MSHIIRLSKRQTVSKDRKETELKLNKILET